jgi:hypothetical protein
MLTVAAWPTVALPRVIRAHINAFESKKLEVRIFIILSGENSIKESSCDELLKRLYLLPDLSDRCPLCIEFHALVH